MWESFAGLNAAEYDQWRRTAEFFSIETRVLQPLISKLQFRSVLDVGCGTGVWSEVIKGLSPNTSILGVDISRDMVAYASAKQQPGVTFKVADCCEVSDFGEFDLIICAMSADYIGFSCLRRILIRCLAHNGTGLFWVLDPGSYEIEGRYFVKQWTFDGRMLTESVAIYDPEALRRIFELSAFTVDEIVYEFDLQDKRKRRLRVFKVSRPRQLD